MIIVVGGVNKDRQALNDVIMYDTKTGQRRLEIVGENSRQGFLNSVECFTICTKEWRELPGKTQERKTASYVVKSRNSQLNIFSMISFPFLSVGSKHEKNNVLPLL